MGGNVELVRGDLTRPEGLFAAVEGAHHIILTPGLPRRFIPRSRAKTMIPDGALALLMAAGLPGRFMYMSALGTTPLPLTLHAPGQNIVVRPKKSKASPFCALMARTNVSCAASYALQQRLEDTANLEQMAGCNDFGGHALVYLNRELMKNPEHTASSAAQRTQPACCCGSAKPSEQNDTPSSPTEDTYPLEVCVVSGQPLGSMGEPYVFTHEGREVRLCCKVCLEAFEKDPSHYLASLERASRRAKSS